MARAMRRRRWWRRLLGAVGLSLARTGHALSRQAGDADFTVAPELAGGPPAHWLELLSQSDVPLVWLERRADDEDLRFPPAGWRARVLWRQALHPAAEETGETPTEAIGRPHYEPAIPSSREPLPMLRVPGVSVAHERSEAAKWPQTPPDRPTAPANEGRYEAHGLTEMPPAPSPHYTALPDQSESLPRRPLLRWTRLAPPGKTAWESAPDAPTTGSPVPDAPAAGTRYSPPRPTERRPAHYASLPARPRPTLRRASDAAPLAPAGPDYGGPPAREMPLPAPAGRPHYGRRQRPSPAETRWPELPAATEAAAQRYQAAVPASPMRPAWPETAPATAARPDPFAALGAGSLPAEQWPALPPDRLATEPAPASPRLEEAHRLRLEREQRGE